MRGKIVYKINCFNCEIVKGARCVFGSEMSLGMMLLMRKLLDL